MRAADARLLDGSPLMNEGAIAAFRAHAIECYPNECIGFVVASGDYLGFENVSPDPTRTAFPPRGTVPALLSTGNLRALCHSHPNGLDCPSEPDMRQQGELLVPFVLCATNGEATTEPFAWGDQLLDDAPLVGRPFRHGVTDCYSLVRAYFRQERDVLLPDYPRNWEWWQDQTSGEKDLYRRFFVEAGFRQIDASEVVPGDCFLAAIRSEVPNHAGVVLDAGLALHHSTASRAVDPSRLSKREPLARLAPFVTHWVRRD